MLIRSRETAAEYFLPVTFRPSRTTVDGGEQFRVLLHGEAKLDAETAAGGAALARGIWDVVARITSCGWTKDARLGSVRSPAADDHCVPAVVGAPARVVTPFWTDKGNLSLDVAQRSSQLGRELVVTRPEARTAAGGLALTIPMRAVVAQPVTDAAVRLVHEASGRTVDTDAELAPAVAGGTAGSTLRAQVVTALEPGRWSVEVRLVGPERGEFTALPATVTVPAGTGAPVVEVLSRAARAADGASKEPGRDRLDGDGIRRRGRRLVRRLQRGISRRRRRQR